MNRLLLGVDGGGTKTIARVCVAGGESGQLCVLGSGVAAGSNPYSVGWESAEQTIVEASRAASRQAGLDSPPDIAVLSIAGCGCASARDRLARELGQTDIARQIAVVPDTAPLVSDAPDGVPIVGVIAGTGSSAIGKLASGEMLQIGGWGYLIDDAGSGFAVGQATLKALCRYNDSEQRFDSGLAESVLSQLDADSIGEIKSRIYTSKDPRSAIASIARITIEAAQQGSTEADEICRAQAGELAKLAADCARRIGAFDREAECSMAGGLLLGSPYYRCLFTEALKNAWPGAQPLMAPDAACGCCRIASREPAVSR